MSTDQDNTTTTLQHFLRHHAASADLLRNAARYFFRSPYGHDELAEVADEFKPFDSFTAWLKSYVGQMSRPPADPGHDPAAMLRLRLTACALDAVDWPRIVSEWHEWAKGECEINGIQL